MNYIRKCWTVILLLPSFVFAQNTLDYNTTSSAKQSLQYAQGFINDKDYKRAEKQLKHTIKIKDDFAIAYRELGKVYIELQKYELAIETLERSFALDKELSRAALFECGEAYFQLGTTDTAFDYFEQFQAMKHGKYANKSKESGLELTYELHLEERERNLAFIQQMDTNQFRIRPVPLSQHINSKHDDYLPTITSDGMSLVYTRQQISGDENVMISHFDEGEWQEGRSFGNTINTNKNEGMAKFEAHGKAFYFAGCMRSDTEGGCDIYKADWENGEVSSVERLDGNLNSTFWDSQPSITCDGQFMYFSSTRKEGSQGGSDIWVSRRMTNGEWNIPINLGPIVNTPGDEEAPFISSDGSTLYFTSNTHPGQGDGDLFMTTRTGGKWSTPMNMGYPINSPGKELGFYVQADGKTAYFSSARKGGQGGLDIYKIELPKVMKPATIVHLEGYVLDVNTRKPIESEVKVSRKGAEWNMQTDEEGWFYICLPANKGYSFQVEHEGYEYYIGAQYLVEQDNVAPVKFEIELEPRKAKPELVSKGPVVTKKTKQFFFEFDSYKITQTAKKDLKSLVQLLKKEEDWRVEVVGYADKNGDIKYNQMLSEKRAGSIVNYLKDAGIKVDKVVKHEGRGSAGISDDDEEARQNRRVDVVLRRDP